MVGWRGLFIYSELARWYAPANVAAIVIPVPRCPFARFLPMPTFVVSLLLPESFEDDFIALISRHRDFINGLLNEKIIETYAISSDRSRG